MIKVIFINTPNRIDNVVLEKEILIVIGKMNLTSQSVKRNQDYMMSHK